MRALQGIGGGQVEHHADRGSRRAPPREGLGRCLSLEPGRTDFAERRVTASLVIEHLDVVEQRHLGVAVARKALGLFALDLHALERIEHRFVLVLDGRLARIRALRANRRGGAEEAENEERNS